MDSVHALKAPAYTTLYAAWVIWVGPSGLESVRVVIISGLDCECERYSPSQPYDGCPLGREGVHQHQRESIKGLGLTWTVTLARIGSGNPSARSTNCARVPPSMYSSTIITAPTEQPRTMPTEQPHTMLDGLPHTMPTEQPRTMPTEQPDTMPTQQPHTLLNGLPHTLLDGLPICLLAFI